MYWNPRYFLPLDTNNNKIDIVKISTDSGEFVSCLIKRLLIWDKKLDEGNHQSWIKYWSPDYTKYSPPLIIIQSQLILENIY